MIFNTSPSKFEEVIRYYDITLHMHSIALCYFIEVIVSYQENIQHQQLVDIQNSIKCLEQMFLNNYIIKVAYDFTRHGRFL